MIIDSSPMFSIILIKWILYAGISGWLVFGLIVYHVRIEEEKEDNPTAYIGYIYINKHICNIIR
jgi:hypothetical protein